MKCQNKLKQLTLALHNYESANGVFPSGTVNLSPANGSVAAGDDPNGRNGGGAVGIGGPLGSVTFSPTWSNRLCSITSRRFGRNDQKLLTGSVTAPTRPRPSATITSTRWIALRTPSAKRRLSNGTNMEDLARGNYARVLQKAGYGSAYTG